MKGIVLCDLLAWTGVFRPMEVLMLAQAECIRCLASGEIWGATGEMRGFLGCALRLTCGSLRASLGMTRLWEGGNRLLEVIWALDNGVKKLFSFEREIF
jgi:hypothetical protein